jgi:type IV secretory pathway VirB4 component
VDNLFFLHSVPDYRCIIYNQLIEIPGQQLTLNKLELKRKRHSGVPDPANMMAVEDIDQLLVDVARENQLLVNAHFNILLCADNEKISKAANYIEAALFQQGIIPSRNAYNQLELFRSALPGGGVELKKYDWFLTTSDAAICLLFKEALQIDEQSDFLIRFTDRQGIPVGIDPADLPMRTGRINNRSKFTLGPSGSGKSFFMNALVEQYCRYNMDVVIVDTGDSYSGLCSYYGGKYITYTEEKPISMNPFAMSQKEFNLEKKDFLKTLIALLWKGADGQLTQIEDTVISNVLSSYYYEHFWLDPGPQNPRRPDKLDFDSFYTYSVERIRENLRPGRIPLRAAQVFLGTGIRHRT